ncbi:kinase-like domain-containing protein [Amanita rubescens]|nr:kinase-like domain-containing protein [Amanita rubescens]
MDDPFSDVPAVVTATHGVIGDVVREPATTRGTPPELNGEWVFDGASWNWRVRQVGEGLLDDSDSDSEAMEELGDGNETQWDSGSPRGPVRMETSYNMQHVLESDTLPSLLSILNAKTPGSSIASVVNANTTDLMCKLLSGEDYLSSAAKLNRTADSQNLLDFMLHMLRYRLLPNQDESVDFNQRARRFMFKIIAKKPVTPWSLIATGVSQPAEQDYIGGGGFGRVYKSELNGEAVALKILYKSDDNALAFCREALMWGSLKHKFVLPFLGIDEHEDGTAYLISPYMEKGTLAQWRKQANPSISEIEKRILEVALGIEYIHSEGIVHGDLRGENVLLDANLHVQIADFGLARLSDATNTRSGAKHIHFAAPELFGHLEAGDDHSADDSARTQMSDIYAFGGLYYEIHYDNIPFAGRQGLQIMAFVSQGIRPPRLDDPHLKDEAWELIKWCWARMPSERPAIKDVAEMMMSDPDRHPLLFLLFVLKDWKPGSCITSVVNASIINLVCRILAREDYLGVVDQLSQAPDVQNLLDFLLHLLRDRRLSNLDTTTDINGRARRLMFKLNSKMPVIPPSLIVTGVNMPAERNYVGSGGFGRVFEGKLQEEVVALKVLYKSDNDVSFCREALMWGSLKHKFVLPFYGIYEVSDGRVPQFFLVSPFMTNGTLAQWRKKADPSVSEIEERILEVAQGVEYIHSVGAVHGDLRGDNILLDANLRVQIADFGLTRLSDATNTQSGAKHLNFSAPELFGFFDNNDFNDVPARTQMTDVYAFGCLFYEIHYDSVPFAGKTDLQILGLHDRGEQPPRPHHPPLSDGVWDMIQRCWGRDALKRPRMKDITKNMTLLSQDTTTEMLLPLTTPRRITGVMKSSSPPAHSSDTRISTMAVYDLPYGSLEPEASGAAMATTLTSSLVEEKHRETYPIVPVYQHISRRRLDPPAYVDSPIDPNDIAADSDTYDPPSRSSSARTPRPTWRRSDPIFRTRRLSSPSPQLTLPLTPIPISPVRRPSTSLNNTFTNVPDAYQPSQIRDVRVSFYWRSWT